MNGQACDKQQNCFMTRYGAVEANITSHRPNENPKEELSYTQLRNYAFEWIRRSKLLFLALSGPLNNDVRVLKHFLIESMKELWLCIQPKQNYA